MTNKKADNQWYGKGFEIAIYIIFNNLLQTNPFPIHLTDKDWQCLLNDARKFIEYYNSKEKIISIEYIGNHTGTMDGDLIINGEKVEIKRVSQGLGTWGNFTIKHIYKYLSNDFKPHTEFMKKVGIYDKFVSLSKNHSWMKKPYATNLLSVDEAKKFGDDLYDLDETWRKDFNKAVFEDLIKHPQNIQRLTNDCVTKRISPKKNMPKKLIVYNYVNNTITNFADIDLIKKEYNETIEANDLGILLDGIRINFSWKNHCGRNLAMYVFLRR